MILFLYGEDTYRSFAKVADLKTKYIDASLGDTNLAQLEGRAIKPNQLAAQIYALPFLAKSRLVVITDILANKQASDELLEILPKVPASTVLVVYERGLPDKRLKLYKQLLKLAKVQEFKPLVGSQLTSWLRGFLNEWQVSIEPQAERELIKRTGGKTLRLATELKKLATEVLSEDPRKITFSLVCEQVISYEVVSVFALTDSLLKNKNTALVTLKKLLDQGENPQYLVAMIASSLRSLALLRWAIDQGYRGMELGKATRLNPFVVKKQTHLAEQLSLKDISAAYSRLADLDIGVKNGTIETSLGLELFVASDLSFRAISI